VLDVTRLMTLWTEPESQNRRNGAAGSVHQCTKHSLQTQPGYVQ